MWLLLSLLSTGEHYPKLNQSATLHSKLLVAMATASFQAVCSLPFRSFCPADPSLAQWGFAGLSPVSPFLPTYLTSAAAPSRLYRILPIFGALDVFLSGFSSLYPQASQSTTRCHPSLISTCVSMGPVLTRRCPRAVPRAPQLQYMQNTLYVL